MTRDPDGPPDPFAVLGLPPTATADEVRAARRALARALHPDVPGAAADDGRRMALVNQATDEALAAVAAAPRPSPLGEGTAGGTAGGDLPGSDEEATFSVDLLPVEAFEVLLLAFSSIGDPKVVDEPYLLEGQVDDPSLCFARLHLVPEAGGSIVTVEVFPYGCGGLVPPPASMVAGRLLHEVAVLGPLG